MGADRNPPVGNNNSMRASWQRSQLPIRYLELSPETNQYRPVLRPIAKTRTEIFWIHDTTDDPSSPRTVPG